MLLFNLKLNHEKSLLLILPRLIGAVTILLNFISNYHMLQFEGQTGKYYNKFEAFLFLVTGANGHQERKRYPPCTVGSKSQIVTHYCFTAEIGKMVVYST